MGIIRWESVCAALCKVLCMVLMRGNKEKITFWSSLNSFSHKYTFSSFKQKGFTVNTKYWSRKVHYSQNQASDVTQWVIEKWEQCPVGFNLAQSKINLTSSKHVGPSDAVKGPTVDKKHHKSYLYSVGELPCWSKRINADELLPIACSF